MVAVVELAHGADPDDVVLALQEGSDALVPGRGAQPQVAEVAAEDQKEAADADFHGEVGGLAHGGVVEEEQEDAEGQGEHGEDGRGDAELADRVEEGGQIGLGHRGLLWDRVKTGFGCGRPLEEACRVLHGG